MDEPMMDMQEVRRRHPHNREERFGGVGGGAGGWPAPRAPPLLAPPAVAAVPQGGSNHLSHGNASSISGGGGSVLLPSSRSFSAPDRQCMTWSKVTVNNHLVPPPRSGAASVVVNERLYVFGGYGGGTGRLDDFYSFHFETGVWEQVQVLSERNPGCRENNGVVIADSSRHIILFGGYDGRSWLNDLWRFDIETKKWECIQESSDPVVRNNSNNNIVQPPGAADLDGVAPGQVAVDDGAAAAELMQDDAVAVAAPNVLALGRSQQQQRQKQAVVLVQGRIPSRRFGYVSVVHEGKFVLWGGFDGQRWLNDMYVFDFATKTWSEIHARGALPSARSCPAWAKDDYFVYIHGGYDGVERKADFFACDLATYTWTEMSSLGNPPSPRYFHSCCLYGAKMYLYGGYNGNERLADMYAYDFETSYWSPVDCTLGDAPSGRSSLVAQIHGPNFYVFGGYNGVSVLNDFYKFRLKPIDVPPPGLIKDFCRLINHPDLADVRFLVEGQIVYAHKAVLAIRSEYFRVMLCGGMRESSVVTLSSASAPEDLSGEPAPIPLPDVSYYVFLKVLEFLYTDTIRDVSFDIGVHLLIASELFMLDRLKALCEDLIRRDIHVDSVVHILVASHRHNAVGLKDICLEFILRHLNDPVIMSGLSDLRTEPDLLLEIIKRNTQQPSTMGATLGLSSNNNNMAGSHQGQEYPGASWR